MSERLSSGSPPEWIRCTLGELCRRRGGSIQTGPFGSELHAEDYKDEGTPIITVEHLREGKILHDDLPLVGKSDSARLGRYSLSEGDLVFSRVGAIDRCAFVTELEHGWLFSGRCLRVRPSNGDVNPKFLAYSLNSWQKRRWIRNHSVGSTMACLNTSIISAVPIDLPSGPEQYRIAEILSTLDETIEQTEMVIAKYQQMKAGLMQDLFTRGVTPDGRLRPTCAQALHLYKESPLGWIPREWDVQPLSELAQINRGKFSVRPRNDPRYYDGPYPFIQTGDVALSGGRLLFASCQSLNAKGLAVSRLFERGTIMVTIAANIADTCTLGVPMCAPDSLVGIKPYRDELTQFIELCIRRRKHWFESRAPQTAQKNINLSDLRPMLVPVPTEQEIGHIVQAFDSLERSTEANESQLNKLRQLKLGLMHDLLTARVRVKATESEEVPA